MTWPFQHGVRPSTPAHRMDVMEREWVGRVLRADKSSWRPEGRHLIRWHNYFLVNVHQQGTELRPSVIRKQVVEEVCTDACEFLPSTSRFLKRWKNLEWALEVKLFVAQSHLTLHDSMDCSLPGSSVHGILRARILEWVAIPFSRGSSPGTEPKSPVLQADSLPSEPLTFGQFHHCSSKTLHPLKFILVKY